MFHWALVVLVGALWLTQYENWMPQHMLCGYATATLLLFRLAWGLAGSETARFSRFVKGPRAVLHHLRGICRRVPDAEAGHNPAGGWMVALMLALLSVQVATGLCANDQISVQGPLADAVGADNSDLLSHIHAVNFRLIEAAISLHLLALGVYRLLGYRLVAAMVTGRKQLPASIPQPRLASPTTAAVLFCAAAGAVTVLVLYFAG